MIKYEVANIDGVDITLDLSIFQKTDELYFNATEVAQYYGKNIKEWFKNVETKEYLEQVLIAYPFLNGGNSTHLEFGKLVKTSKGRYGGTYLHNILALPFARWCSAKIAVQLDKFLMTKIKEEQIRKMERLKARTGYLPLTNAIQEAHDPCEFYHYSNEANMITKIIMGKNAKQLKEELDTENVRDAMNVREIHALENLQRANTVLIQMGISYDDRKEKLTTLYNKKFSQEACDNHIANVVNQISCTEKDE